MTAVTGRARGASPRTLAWNAKFVGAQTLGYLSNHVVNRLPSYSLRRAWYDHAIGIRIGRGSSVQLGVRVWFHGPGQNRRGGPWDAACGGSRVGAGTRINRDCTLDTRGGLRIGDHVSISPEVVILTADHGRDLPGFPLQHRPVVIEDYVWIGMRAMILPGVRVGRGAVVAAGAIVTRDVEPMSVVAGVPARVVAHRDPAALDYAFADEPLALFE
jgi:maltose O-acetyltransferase